jgi:hypothetical protein
MFFVYFCNGKYLDGATEVSQREQPEKILYKKYLKYIDEVLKTQNIYHRDFNSGNIFILSDRVVLLDFDVATDHDTQYCDVMISNIAKKKAMKTLNDNKQDEEEVDFDCIERGTRYGGGSARHPKKNIKKKTRKNSTKRSSHKKKKILKKRKSIRSSNGKYKSRKSLPFSTANQEISKN